MDINQLKEKLNDLGIDEKEYSLEGDLQPNTIILYQNYTKWDVFYLDERGGRNVERSFISKEDAFDYMYKLFFDEIEIKKKFGLN